MVPAEIMVHTCMDEYWYVQTMEKQRRAHPQTQEVRTTEHQSLSTTLLASLSTTVPSSSSLHRQHSECSSPSTEVLSPCSSAPGAGRPPLPAAVPSDCARCNEQAPGTSRVPWGKLGTTKILNTRLQQDILQKQVYSEDIHPASSAHCRWRWGSAQGFCPPG